MHNVTNESARNELATWSVTTRQTQWKSAQPRKANRWKTSDAVVTGKLTKIPVRTWRSARTTGIEEAELWRCGARGSAKSERAAPQCEFGRCRPVRPVWAANEATHGLVGAGARVRRCCAGDPACPVLRSVQFKICLTPIGSKPVHCHTLRVNTGIGARVGYKLMVGAFKLYIPWQGN